MAESPQTPQKAVVDINAKPDADPMQDPVIRLQVEAAKGVAFNLLKSIKQDVNARMQANIVQDVLIEEFNYISKDDLRK